MRGLDPGKAAEKVGCLTRWHLSGRSRGWFCDTDGAAEAAPLQNRVKTWIFPQAL